MSGTGGEVETNKLGSRRSNQESISIHFEMQEPPMDRVQGILTTTIERF